MYAQGNLCEVYALPMIETVLEDEIELHNSLEGVISPNLYCHDVLKDQNVKNLIKLPFGLGTVNSELKERKLASLRSRDKLRFLHIAGHNPSVRKNTLNIIRAFEKLASIRDDIRLEVFCMDDLSALVDFTLSEAITLNSGKFARSDILEAYEKADMSIQLSTHEGLGLGFYESLSLYTPVVCHDGLPHSEVVKNNKTGIVISSKTFKLRDNQNAIVPGFEFNQQDFVNKLVNITARDIEGFLSLIEPEYFAQNSAEAFTGNFVKLLAT